MKRMEKYLALGLVGMLALSLTACGGGGNTSEPAAAPDNTPAEEAPAETPAADTADAAEGTPAASGEAYDITWVTCSTESEFWQYQQIGMENAAADMEAEHGITINFTTVGPATEAETEAYIRAFENAIASKPDAIISATQVPDSTRSISKDAMDQGIIVNFTNCGLETLDSTEFADCYNQYYTTVSADIGDMAGEIMLQLLDEAGIAKEGVIAMEFSNVNPSLQPRMDNFKAYIEANSDIEVLDTLYNNNDLAQAQADIENEIATYGDKLIGIYGANNTSGWRSRLWKTDLLTVSLFRMHTARAMRLLRTQLRR